MARDVTWHSAATLLAGAYNNKATPNQLLVSHPPSALKLMRADGIFGE